MMPVPLLNCIPLPADTAPDSYNSGAKQIEAAITPLTSAIVVAHIVGEPADMPGILEMANAHSLPVVEDCAQALRGEGLTCVMANDLAAMPHRQDWCVRRRGFATSGYPWTSPDYRGDAGRQFPCPDAMAAMERSFVLFCNESWRDGDTSDAVAILRKVEAGCRR